MVFIVSGYKGISSILPLNILLFLSGGLTLALRLIVCTFILSIDMDGSFWSPGRSPPQMHGRCKFLRMQITGSYANARNMCSSSNPSSTLPSQTSTFPPSALSKMIGTRLVCISWIFPLIVSVPLYQGPWVSGPWVSGPWVCVRMHGTILPIVDASH